MKRWDHPEVARRHVIAMTREYDDDVAMTVAKCQCGWISRLKLPQCGLQDAAIERHWQNVIDAFEGVPARSLSA